MSTLFPPVENADDDGFLAWGGSATPEYLLEAYSHGIFPWPPEEGVLYWFSPPQRAVLIPLELRISARLARELRKERFEIRVDTCFDAVIEQCACSANRKGQHGTWVTQQLIHGYSQLHRMGYAHSIEAFLDDRLVGGMYGVQLGSMFAGESMFYIERDASKYCLVWLVQKLQLSNQGFLDCQMMTPLLESFGAKYCSRNEFLKMLRQAHAEPFPLVSITPRDD